MAKFFSVAVELEDGKSKSLPIRGESSGEVFKQAKQTPGVRRVGKVREINQHEHDALVHGKAIDHPAHRSAPAEREEKMAANQVARMGHAISGPRVVMHARRIGGEQPFRHLKPPPERPKPPKPVKHEAPAKHEAAAKPAIPAESVQTPPKPAPSAKPLEYRIVKSRRQDGHPYLLQRGHWHQQKGKRVFTVEWEKGFPDREKAAKHEEWVKTHEREMAEVEE